VNKKGIAFEKVVELAHNLSVLDKLRLIENLTCDIENSIQSRGTQRRHSLRGVLKGCSISGKDIDQARQEMWGNFPREDF
jgi:hypothetical protein